MRKEIFRPATLLLMALELNAPVRVYIDNIMPAISRHRAEYACELHYCKEDINPMVEEFSGVPGLAESFLTKEYRKLSLDRFHFWRDRQPILAAAIVQVLLLGLGIREVVRRLKKQN